MNTTRTSGTGRPQHRGQFRITGFLLQGILLFLFFSPEIHAQQTPLDRKITIRFDHITVQEALMKIEKLTGISFAHNSSIPAFKDKVTGTYTSRALRYILGDLFHVRT